jgi:hypothetical protein
MTSRYLGAVAVERFLAVERYRESYQVTSSHHSPRSSGRDRGGGHPDKPAWRTAADPRR